MPINYTRIKNIKDIRKINQLFSCVISVNSMKYINDLTYLSHITQTKLVAKDKKQKNKYSQIALINDDQCSDDVSDEILEGLPLIEENERRTGDDRRKTQQNRGRYVESRLKKNRRYKKEVFLVI